MCWKALAVAVEGMRSMEHEVVDVPDTADTQRFWWLIFGAEVLREEMDRLARFVRSDRIDSDLVLWSIVAHYHDRAIAAYEEALTLDVPGNYAKFARGQITETQQEVEELETTCVELGM